ncbi:MAG TPA: hypothetical protein VIU86_20110 [Gaiellaceae bacterium]
MAEPHPFQELHLVTAQGIVAITVDELQRALRELGYHAVQQEHWEEAARVVSLARRVCRLRDNGEESSKLNDELGNAIDRLDGEDDG